MIMNIYFYAGNREINVENVKHCYAMIAKFGFQPAISKIKLVDAAGLGDVDIERVTIEQKNLLKPLSINNFVIKKEKVKNKSEKQKAKITADGQHSQIALAILEAEKKVKFDAVTMTKVVTIPENMDLVSFIYCINSGRAWTPKDFSATENSTGNPQIDYIENKIKEAKLEPVVAYSFYTLGQPTIKTNIAKDLKLGMNKLPKKLKLNDETQELGDKILEAMKPNLPKSLYNNGRFAKGFKSFYGLCKPKLEHIIELISAIDKDFWFEGEEPEGSAEAKQYAEHFRKWYEELFMKSEDDKKNSSEEDGLTTQPDTSSEEGEAASVSEENTTSQPDATPEDTASKE